MDDGVKNAVEHRGLLYLLKGNRTYVTSDNGSAPVTWQTNLVDAGIGTEALGIGYLLDQVGATKDAFLVAHRSGLYNFIGSYSEDRNLAWKIQDLWDSINPLYLHLTQVQIDPIKKLIYVAVTLDSKSSSPSHILVGNYQQGLDPKSIRWSKWTTQRAPTSIWTETKFTDGTSRFLFGSSAGDIWKYVASSRRDTDGADLIPAYLRFGYVSFQDEGAVDHFNALRFRVRGYGQLDITTYTLDDNVTDASQTIILAATPGKEINKHIIQESEGLSVKIGTNSMHAANPSWFTMTHLRIAGKPRWGQRPTN
jgi:hypothetical protein